VRSGRRFVHAAVRARALAGLGRPLRALPYPADIAILSGDDLDLVVEEIPIQIAGKPRIATTVNGSVPGPTLRFREGETVTIRVANRLAQDTSIHWHGLRLPADMDEVPGLSLAGIRPGGTFTYRFPVKQTGTY
jgi:FtsP/CotA-like multicopper oxidase with cupredoxin domain